MCCDCAIRPGRSSDRFHLFLFPSWDNQESWQNSQRPGRPSEDLEGDLTSCTDVQFSLWPCLLTSSLPSPQLYSRDPSHANFQTKWLTATLRSEHWGLWLRSFSSDFNTNVAGVCNSNKTMWGRLMVYGVMRNCYQQWTIFNLCNKSWESPLKQCLHQVLF